MTALTSATQHTKQLFVIDKNVDGWRDLVNNAGVGVSVLLLDPLQNGLTQIANAITAYSNLDAIHILSHGNVASLQLGSATLNSENLNQYTQQLNTIGNALSENGDLLLYGCNVAQGEIGKQFIQALAQVTGADVAASDDLTGNSFAGADWVLEINAGNVETNTFTQADIDEFGTNTLAEPLFGNLRVNPFGLIGSGIATSPALADIDKDGDLDAFIRDASGRIQFFRNTGTSQQPNFTAENADAFGLSFIISGTLVNTLNGFGAKLALVDIDADGDLDAFAANWMGGTRFVRNTGTASSPNFTGGFNSTGFGNGLINQAFADIDGDGDFDAFMGDSNGNTQFYRNIGTASSSSFSAEASNFGLTNVGNAASPSFVDIDKDGDLDAFIGNYDGNTLFFRNIGTVNNPNFSAEGIRFGFANSGLLATPTFVDINNDGDLDAFVGNKYGCTVFQENITPINHSPTGNVSIDITTPQQGQILTASNTLADVDGLGAITYQWKAGAANIGVGETYAVTAAEVGKVITVTASYTDGLGNLESVSSVGTFGVTPAPPITTQQIFDSVGYYRFFAMLSSAVYLHTGVGDEPVPTEHRAFELDNYQKLIASGFHFLTATELGIASSGNDMAVWLDNINPFDLTSPLMSQGREYNYDFKDGFYGTDAILSPASAFASVGATSDALFITFRGTDQNWDWVTDASGMHQQYAMYGALTNAINHYLTLNPNTNVYVSGHSLGGQMATLYMSEYFGDNRFIAVEFEAANKLWSDNQGNPLPSYNANIVNVEMPFDPVPDLGINRGDVIHVRFVDKNGVEYVHGAAADHPMSEVFKYIGEIESQATRNPTSDIPLNLYDRAVALANGHFDNLMIEAQKAMYVPSADLKGNDTVIIKGSDGLTYRAFYNLTRNNPIVKNIIIEDDVYSPSENINYFTDPTDINGKVIVGNAGNNILIGGAGSDILIGGADQDSLVGGDGDDVLFGGQYKAIKSSLSLNTLLPLNTKNWITQYADGTTLNAEDVSYLYGGNGKDTMYGGGDNDYFFIDVNISANTDNLDSIKNFWIEPLSAVEDYLVFSASQLGGSIVNVADWSAEGQKGFVPSLDWNPTTVNGDVAYQWGQSAYNFSSHSKNFMRVSSLDEYVADSRAGDNPLFLFNQTNGNLYFDQDGVRDINDIILVAVISNDTGSKPLSEFVQTQILVMDSFNTLNYSSTVPNNTRPSSVSITTDYINENVPANSVIGILSSTDPDVNNTFTYSLAAGGIDNSAFSIVGNQLKINSSPDFETKSSYNILVRTTDQGGLFFDKALTISINDLNEIPTNPDNTINENIVAGSIIGTFSSVDPNASYSLVTGSRDNSAFTIVGNQLKINISPDFETKAGYSLLVRTTEQSGLFFDWVLTIGINNINEAPTNLAITASSINENVAAGSVIGTLRGIDPDANNTFTYSFATGGVDNSAFSIVGNQLTINSSPDFETKSNYSLNVRTTDQGGLFVDKPLTITVTAINETPVDTSGSNSYTVNSLTDVITEQAGKGWDVVTSNVDNYTLPDNVEVLLLGAGVNRGSGNAQNNYLLGNSLDNTVNGGLGNDVMAGYAGNDTYFVDSTNINAEWAVSFAMGDVVIEGVNEGFDTVNASVSYVLRANIENLVLTSNAIGGGGNALNNIITGNAADNILNGGTGVDTVIGGAGNDRYFVDETNDVTTELGGEGSDIVFSTATNYALNINVENLIVWGTGLNGTGNAGDNIIYGNALNNTLTDGAGSDILVGGRGKDTYNLSVDSATDTLYVSAGDSLVSGYDKANNFNLGGSKTSSAGTDRLDLLNTSIATNAIVDGINAGMIMSHRISNGIISFGSANSFTAPVTITASTNLGNVFGYLQANITGNKTVAFVAESSTFVFQDGGVTDTLIELVGVTASSVNTTGFGANAVWIV